MNTGQINGFALNGGAAGGNNATLTGGLTVASALSALMISSAVLAGGVYNTPTSGGRVSTALNGGVSSTQTLTGDWFIAAALRDGIKSEGEVFSNLGRADGMRDGVYSTSGYGGQVVTNARLQPDDTVGDSSQVGGGMLRSAGLLSGVAGSSYVGGNLRGSTVLIADGVKSTSKVGGNDIGSGRFLSGGVSSTATLSALLWNNGIFSGGFLSTSLVGHEIDISALLQGGMSQVGVSGSPVMRISAQLHGGAVSDPDFGALLIASPASNGGITSDASLSASLNVWAMLSGGLFGGDTADSKNVAATQILRDGMASGSLFSADLRTAIWLLNGASSSQSIGGGIVQGLQDPFINNSALEVRSATEQLSIIHPLQDI